jgi:hypothetical protein
METATVTRREIGETASSQTVTIRPVMVMVMVARPAGSVKIPFIRASRPATDGIGYRTTRSTRITVSRFPTIGISPTIQSTLRRSTRTSPS